MFLSSYFLPQNFQGALQLLVLLPVQGAIVERLIIGIAEIYFHIGGNAHVREALSLGGEILADGNGNG